MRVNLKGFTGPIPYLFLPPPEISSSRTRTIVSLPDLPYWSCHRLGTVTYTNATSGLALPEVQVDFGASLSSFNPLHYHALRNFHTAKGFNPYSQDIARHLGLPLYELVANRRSHISACTPPTLDLDANANHLFSPATPHTTEALSAAYSLDNITPTSGQPATSTIHE